MSDEIRTAVDLRASIVDQRGGIERYDGPQRRLLDALVFELAKKPNEIDVRIVTDLTALLPQPVSVPERDNHPDPRLVMFKIYMEMRERGEVPPEGWHQHRINELELENERLRAQLVGAGLAPALPDANSSAKRTNLAIDPTEVVPPGEYLGAPPMRGPDDPPKRPPVIEGKANPPAASATSSASRPQDWDSTDHGRAWRAWVDTGGAHYDRWGNHNA
jgi:hypothetical protein